ncbi:MAG: zonular occludens toxin domain-containing protein [Solirubrobacteraceae bacterium]
MLVLVTGTPGAGKSYYAVRKMLDAVEGGRYVASNVALVDGWAELLVRPVGALESAALADAGPAGVACPGVGGAVLRVA